MTEQGMGWSVPLSSGRSHQAGKKATGGLELNINLASILLSHVNAPRQQQQQQ